MKCIPRVVVTDAMLTASNAAEPGPGEVAWASGATYAVGDVRINAHRKWERTVAGSGTLAPGSDPANWRDAGPTNRWAMWDLERSSQTEVAGGAIVVQLTPGRRVNAIGLVGLWGASVRIQMSVGASTVYDTTIGLLLRNTTTWSQYYYGEFRVRPAVVRFDLPMAAGAVITLTIQPTDGYARCGGVVIGMAEDLGTIIDTPVSDVENFSRVTRDDYGIATLVKRRNVPLLQHRVRADAARLDRLRALRDDLDAVPALWSGADDREASPFFDTLLVLGIAKKWSISISGPLAVVSDLQLEEI